MVFVTVKTDISGPRGPASSEERDLVYRGEPDRTQSSAPPAADNQTAQLRVVDENGALALTAAAELA